MIAVKLGPASSFAVVAAPIYFEAHGKQLAPPDLLAHRCIRIRLPNGPPYRWHFEKDGNSVQIDVESPITLDEATLALLEALQRIAIGFFMESDVRDAIAAGRLERVLTNWTPPTTSLCLYYPGRKNPSAEFRAFVDMAREMGRAATLAT